MDKLSEHKLRLKNGPKDIIPGNEIGTISGDYHRDELEKFMLNLSIKILSIILWCASDFRIKIKIIKKSTNLIFFCFENNDNINISVVKLKRGT